MNQDQQIEYIAGAVGSDPESRGTKIGELVEFRLGVTRSYPRDGQQYGDTEWYSVMVKHPGLQQSVMNEVYKGAKVVVQGNVQSKTYNDKLQLSIWADRIGLVEYLRREQVSTPTRQASPEVAAFIDRALESPPLDDLGF